jgi:hypothetical protein
VKRLQSFCSAIYIGTEALSDLLEYLHPRLGSFGQELCPKNCRDGQMGSTAKKFRVNSPHRPLTPLDLQSLRTLKIAMGTPEKITLPTQVTGNF